MPLPFCCTRQDKFLFILRNDIIEKGHIFESSFILRDSLAFANDKFAQMPFSLRLWIGLFTLMCCFEICGGCKMEVNATGLINFKIQQLQNNSRDQIQQPVLMHQQCGHLSQASQINTSSCRHNLGENIRNFKNWTKSESWYRRSWLCSEVVISCSTANCNMTWISPFKNQPSPYQKKETGMLDKKDKKEEAESHLKL